MGYYALADIYGEGNLSKKTQEAGKQAGYYKIMLELPKAHSVGIGPIGKIRSPDNIVVIGLFWWYGVLEAARAGMKVQGVVSFHGGLRQRVNNVIKRVLVLMVQMIYMFLQLK
jgi:hypothetical protein